MTHKSPQLPNRHSFGSCKLFGDVTSGRRPTHRHLHSPHGLRSTIVRYGIHSSGIIPTSDMPESEISACPDEAFLTPCRHQACARVRLCAPRGCVRCRTLRATFSDSKQTGCVASRPIMQHTGVSDLRKHNTTGAHICRHAAHQAHQTIVLVVPTSVWFCVGNISTIILNGSLLVCTTPDVAGSTST